MTSFGSAHCNNISCVSCCYRALSLNYCLRKEEKIFTSEYFLDIKLCWPIIEDFDFVFFLQHLLFFVVLCFDNASHEYLTRLVCGELFMTNFSCIFMIALPVNISRIVNFSLIADFRCDSASL